MFYAVFLANFLKVCEVNAVPRSEIIRVGTPNVENLPASRAHSHRAQLASLASLSAPRARDLIVALRAPNFLDLALCARSCALRIHLSLFLII